MFYLAFVPKKKNLMRTKYLPDVVISRNSKVPRDCAKEVIIIGDDEDYDIKVGHTYIRLAGPRVRFLNPDGSERYQIPLKDSILLEIDEKDNITQVKEEFILPENA